MTKGNAIIVCASGTSHGEAIQLRGALLNEMMKPKPSVTADAPSGSIRIGSRMRSRRLGFANAEATGNPKRRESITVIPAYWREFFAASIGGT